MSASAAAAMSTMPPEASPSRNSRRTERGLCWFVHRRSLVLGRCEGRRVRRVLAGRSRRPWRSRNAIALATPSSARIASPSRAARCCMDGLPVASTIAAASRSEDSFLLSIGAGPDAQIFDPLGPERLVAEEGADDGRLAGPQRRAGGARPAVMDAGRHQREQLLMRRAFDEMGVAGF